MIGQQCPCITGSASDYKNLAPPGNKVPIVDLVFKYGLVLNPPDNDVVQCSERICSGFFNNINPVPKYRSRHQPKKSSLKCVYAESVTVAE